MRIRIAVAGVLAGAICITALYLQYYRFEPSGTVPGWPYAVQAALLPKWLSRVVLIFCALVLFSLGWVAARWSWAGSWQLSILAGAGMGTIAGCLAYGVIGVFWYGLQGQVDVLKNFYLPVTETDGTKIMVEAVFRTGNLIYKNFIQIVPACILVGAFGGLASALVDVKDFWGRRPHSSDGWLLRLSAYLLVVFGILNMMVTVAVLSVMWEKAIESANDLQKQYGVTFDLKSGDGLFLLVAYLAGLMFTFLPAGLTWGWILRAWKQKGKPHLLSTLWLILTVVGAVYYTYKAAGVIRLVIGTEMISYALVLPLALVATLFVGLLAGFMAEPLIDENHHRSRSDWPGYLITYGILGGTQIIMGSPAMAIPLTLITITNIPHLVLSKIVEKSPAAQVAQLFRMQIFSLGEAIVVSVLIGLITAGLVALIRSLFGIRDLPSPREG